MTFTADLHQTVAALTRLAVRGSDHLTLGELDLALIGRAAILDLLTNLHRDLTGIRPRLTHVTAAEIQAHPVAALAAALRQHPRPRPGRAPSDILAGPVRSEAGQAWRDAARHAILADNAWTAGPPYPAEGEQAWAGMADIAAIAAVLADLDGDLAAAVARLPGRTTVANALLEAATAGLALAARETAALAAGGPLLAHGPEPTSAPNRVIIRASEPAKVVAAQHQLAALLRTAKHLHPDRLQTIAIGHVRTCTALANALETAPGGSATASKARLLAVELRHHGRLLIESAGRRGLAASIGPSDALPVREAAELYQALQHSHALIDRIIADPDLAPGFAAALVDTTRALAETADRHLACGTWLIQVQVDDGLTGRPSTPWDQVPAPFQALRAAAVHAEHLGLGLPAATEPTAPLLAPHQALAPAPFAALRTPPCPTGPSIPPLPATARTAAPVRRPLRR